MSCSRRGPVAYINVNVTDIEQKVTCALCKTKQHSMAQGIMGRHNSVAHAVAPCYLAKWVAALTIKW